MSAPPMASVRLLVLSLGGVLLMVSLHLVTAVRTHREHKVHNIVLYPDKHSWCKTTPIKQVVAWPGCVPREIDNNVCVGACFSYTIPQTQPSAPGDVISPYCDSCQPSEVTWQELTLECTNEEEPVETLAPEPTTTPQPGGGANSTSPPLLMQKKVQVIANCSCSSCHAHVHHHSPQSHGEHGDQDAGPAQPAMDVPELMGLMRQAHTRKLAANHSAAAVAAAVASMPGFALHHPHLQVSHPSLPETPEGEEEEEKKNQQDIPTTLIPEPIDIVTPSSEAAPAAFEPPVPLVPAIVDPVAPGSSSSHPHSGAHTGAHSGAHGGHHGTHPHPHHPHPHHAHRTHAHHHGGGLPAHLDVPQERLQPALEGAEMSYQENMVPSDHTPEKGVKDEEF